MTTLLSGFPIEPRRHQDTKALQLLSETTLPWHLCGKPPANEHQMAGSTPLSGSTCVLRTFSRSVPDCIDHEAGLLDLADALLRNAPQAYLQPAFARTLAHIHHCPTCRATLVDLVLTTLHFDAHLPAPAVPNPTEEGTHHVT